VKRESIESELLARLRERDSRSDRPAWLPEESAKTGTIEWNEWFVDSEDRYDV